MSKNEPEISYASLDGRVVHVSSVARGRACGCTCTSCGRSLVARQGPEMTWHFAHEGESSCTTAPETALHRLAKQVLFEAREIVLPAIKITTRHHKTYKIADPERVCFDDVLVETRLGDVIPDLIGVAGERKVLIEIAVTHFVGREKLEKLRLLDLEVVEINLQAVNRSISESNLRRMLVEDLERKEWKHNSTLERSRDEYSQRADLDHKEDVRRSNARLQAAIRKRQEEDAEQERRRQWGIKKRQEEEAERREFWSRKQEEAEASRKAELAAEDAKQKAELEQREIEGRERRRLADEAWEQDRPNREARERREREEHEARKQRRVQEQVERERLSMMRDAEYAATWEAAYLKRRENDLGLLSPQEQGLYRTMIDEQGKTHHEACAIISEARAATLEEREVEYDRTHRHRFKLNARTTRGGYV